MNLFVLDADPYVAAIQNQDLHVKKISLESVQILQTAYPLEDLRREDCPRNQEGNPRGHGYFNHPVCKWARANINNFYWTLEHSIALHQEYLYRFGEEHFSYSFVRWAIKNVPQIPDTPKTEHPQCFQKYPHLITPGDPITGYRKYYKEAKMSFTWKTKTVYASWTKRKVPYWL